jgi:DNA-binding NarL/FixJ family response regulator
LTAVVVIAQIRKPNLAKTVIIGVTSSVKCKECKNWEAKLKCLICEQSDELEKEKNQPRYYSEVITPTKDTPFPELDQRERAVWILYLSNFTEAEIADFIYISQPAVSLCLTRIKGKLKG